MILNRIPDREQRGAGDWFENAVDLLYTLTAFEIFDRLAGPERTPCDVIPLVQHQARATLKLPAQGKDVTVDLNVDVDG